jgi:hypothetical protein
MPQCYRAKNGRSNSSIVPRPFIKKGFSLYRSNLCVLNLKALALYAQLVLVNGFYYILRFIFLFPDPNNFIEISLVEFRCHSSIEFDLEYSDSNSKNNLFSLFCKHTEYTD